MFVTLNSIPQRTVYVDDNTIQDIEEGLIKFSSGQWLPVVESKQEIIDATSNTKFKQAY